MELTKESIEKLMNAENTGDAFHLLKVRKAAVDGLIEKVYLTASNPQNAIDRLLNNPLLPVEGVEDEAAAQIVRLMAAKKLSAIYSHPLLTIEKYEDEDGERLVVSVSNAGTFLTCVGKADFNSWIDSLEDDEFCELEIKPFATFDVFFTFVADQIASGHYTPEEGARLMVEATDALLKHEELREITGWSCDEVDCTKELMEKLTASED